MLTLVLEERASWQTSSSRMLLGFLGSSHNLKVGARRIGRGAIARIGCPLETTSYMLELDDGVASGTARVTLYSRSARRGELDNLAERRRREREHSDRSAAKRKREHCASCREKYYQDQNAFETCAAILYSRKACY